MRLKVKRIHPSIQSFIFFKEYISCVMNLQFFFSAVEFIKDFKIF